MVIWEFSVEKLDEAMCSIGTKRGCVDWCLRSIALGIVLLCFHQAAAASEMIDCSESRLATDFTSLQCEMSKSTGTDYGQFTYYNVSGEQGDTFRNFELGIAGINSYIDPGFLLQEGLKNNFQSRYSWLANARNWSEEIRDRELRYVELDLDYGHCIIFSKHTHTRHPGYKYALTGIYCHKSGRKLSIEDLRAYLLKVSYK